MNLEYLKDNEKILIKPQSKAELRVIKEWFNRYVDGYMHDPMFKNRLWNGKRTKFDKETNTLPMGLWREVYKCCVDNGFEFNFENKKDFPLNRTIKKQLFEDFINDFFNGYEIDGNKFEARPYQLRTAYNILKNQYCNIAVATGGGKTLIYTLTLFYLLNEDPNRKFLLVVPSKTLVTQFYDDITEFNWNNKLPINIKEIFDEGENPRTTDETKEPNIIIGTFQSLSDSKKYPKKWFQQFYSVVGDEYHKGKSNSYKKIFRNSFNSAVYRWGMSGTFPKDETYEMMEIMAKTGPVVDTVTARELMDAGYLTQVKIKQIHVNHNDYDFRDRLESVMKRDRKTAYDLECERIQESHERLHLIKDIVNKCKTNTLILFHNTEYGQKLFNFLNEHCEDKIFHYIDGKVKENGTKKNPENSRKWIKSEMKKDDGKVRVLVASFGTLSTGISISTITNIIFTQSFKKPQVIIQSIGRALRLFKGKKRAYIFDLIDVFNRDEYAYRFKTSFKNILKSHGEQRSKIYDEEDYPFDIIEVHLNEP